MSPVNVRYIEHAKPINVCIHTHTHIYIYIYKYIYVESNPVVNTSVYATPNTLRQTFCGKVYSPLFTTTLHSSVIITLVYNDTKYSVLFTML